MDLRVFRQLLNGKLDFAIRILVQNTSVVRFFVVQTFAAKQTVEPRLGMQNRYELLVVRHPETASGQHGTVLGADYPAEYVRDDLVERVVLVGNDTVHGALEVAEQREPDARAIRVVRHQSLNM